MDIFSVEGNLLSCFVFVHFGAWNLTSIHKLCICLASYTEDRVMFCKNVKVLANFWGSRSLILFDWCHFLLPVIIFRPNLLKMCLIWRLFASVSIHPTPVCSDVGKLPQVQNGTAASASYNGVDAAHACNVLQQLKALYDEAQLTDIVVEVDHGQTFSCHRNVLAAISPYFR